MVTEVISSKFADMLEARGVSRRSFMKLCGTLAVAAGLSELALHAWLRQSKVP